MAEFTGGALLGAVVNRLLDEVLVAVRDVRSRDDNLQELESLLERLKPFVVELRTFLQDRTTHPAIQWFKDLIQQLESASTYIYASTDINNGFLRRLRTSREFVHIYEKISKLLGQASFAQWASELSTTTTLSESLRDQAKILEEMKAGQDRQERLFRQIPQVVRSELSCVRRRDLRRIFSDCATSSRSPQLRDDHSSSSTTTLLARERQWKGAWDISEPQINFGGDLVANTLIENLLNEEAYNKWVGIWAMGGAGKTFTARKVFNDSRIRQHFTGGRFWITVSKERPSEHFLLKQLFTQIPTPAGDSSQFPDDVEDAKIKVAGLLGGRNKVLLVLDDVWQSGIIDSLDVISEDKRGVILVTTRDDEHLRRVAKHAEIVKIPPLSNEHSWDLFSWHAFGATGKVDPPELEAVARAMAEECKGLPLALEVIGASMKDIYLFDREKRRGKSLRGEWEKALKKLRQASAHGYEYKKLYHRLQLSVENLSKEHPLLLDCFFYFAAFPEDHAVDSRHLMNMWIAEGMVRVDDDSLDSAEQEADVLLGWLIGKSMIELTDDGEGCKVHDVMRDLARLNLKRNLDTNRKIEVSERTCLYRPRLNVSQFPRNWTTPAGYPFSVKRLSLFDNNLRTLPEQFNAPHLRVLILSENPLRALPPGFFRVLSRLTVLDLSKTSIEEVPDGVLRSLRSLVLLDLTNCFYLRTISERIADLRNVEVIRLYGCKHLRKLPRLKSSTRLHTFSATIPQDVCIESDNKCAYIPGWGRYGRRVFQWQSLRRLSVFNYGGSCLPDLSHLTVLEELTLCDASRLAELSVSMSQFRALKVLKIVRCSHLTSLPALDVLPCLETLVLESLRALESLPESFGRDGAFPCLKRLELHTLDNVRNYFALHPLAMQQISALVISGSQRFMPKIYATIFSESACFPNLQYIELYSLDYLPNTISSLPKLSLLRCNLPRDKLPPEIVESEEQGKLKIERNLATEREALRNFEPLVGNIVDESRMRRGGRRLRNFTMRCLRKDY